MQLVQIQTYRPQEHGFFVCQKLPLLVVHPSGRYLAFQTRGFEIVLRNTTTGRNIVFGKSGHPYTSLTFSHQYLLATQQTSREVIVYSIKSQKIKSKLGGHRGDISKVVYCRQNELIASISHDLCLIHSQRSLVHLKTLKCSTSSYVDCGFSVTGGLFVTSFKDGSILLWDPIEWEHKSSAVIAHSPKVAVGNGFVLAVHDQKQLWLSQASQPNPIYQVIHPFWNGCLFSAVFIDHYLIINAEDGLYITELKYQNSFKITQVKKVATSAMAWLSHSQYQSILVTLTDNCKMIQFLRLEGSMSKVDKLVGNPLTNEGLVCAGGYSTEEGCFMVNGQITSNYYGKAQQQIEPITRACYAELPDSMSLPKLKQFLKKHYALPDKYRPVAYRYALKLSISPSQFRQLQRKGLHASTQLLQSNYPIENSCLAQKMKQTMSLLAHWAPILGVDEHVPSIVFPFVCLFGQDKFMCFQILYRLFTGPLAFIFQQFPIANAGVLQNLWQILQKEDPQLAAHLEDRDIPFARLSWALLSSFFTSALSREGFLAVTDNVLMRVDEPETVLFMCLGYIVFNRKRIMSVDDEKSAKKIVEQEQTLHLGKYMAMVEKLQNKYKKAIRYPLNKTLKEGNIYHNIECPPDAVKMHQTRCKITIQELRKQRQAEAHREKMLEDMKKMTINARRQSERQILQQQAYKMHCQEQQNYNIKLKEVDRSERVAMLEGMMDQLVRALEGQKAGREMLRQYVPAVQHLQANTDQELQDLQLRLMRLMAEVRPATSLKHLASQPVNAIKKQMCSEGLRGAVGARLGHQLWQLDTLAHRNQAVLCQNRVLSSIKH